MSTEWQSTAFFLANFDVPQKLGVQFCSGLKASLLSFAVSILDATVATSDRH